MDSLYSVYSIYSVSAGNVLGGHRPGVVVVVASWLRAQEVGGCRRRGLLNHHLPPSPVPHQQHRGQVHATVATAPSIRQFCLLLNHRNDINLIWLKCSEYMYYMPPVLILGIDLKATKYRAINATLTERETSPFEDFENCKKWGVSTKLLIY